MPEHFEIQPALFLRPAAGMMAVESKETEVLHRQRPVSDGQGARTLSGCHVPLAGTRAGVKLLMPSDASNHRRAGIAFKGNLVVKQGGGAWA